MSTLSVTHSRGLGLAGLALILTAGPAGCAHRADVAVRPEFIGYDKVAIWPRYEAAASDGGLQRVHEELFLPLYMQAFPQHRIVERRDLQVVLGEQDFLPERLDPKLRAEVRRVYGVKAFVFPNYTPELAQLAIKVIDTETGEIVASSVTKQTSDSEDASRHEVAEALIREAIREPHRAAAQAGSKAK
ncbi:MAG: hypothetical protein HRF50_03650 [Phycisphaerae bacterium]|jgi:hypothetical protein